MKKTTYVLLTFIFVDIVFLTLHVLYSLQYVDNKNFRINLDGGYGEIFQYFKFISAALILLYLANLMRSRFIVLWSILAMYLFLDDWIRLHERIGGHLISSVLVPFTDETYNQG